MGAILAVCAGGALGSGARYALAGAAKGLLGASFPWGTFLANVLGSFLLGFFARAGLESRALPPNVRLALTTGFCGGFTTYSTFNLETLGLFEGGEPLKAGLYVVATLVVCLLAGSLGFLAGRVLH